MFLNILQQTAILDFTESAWFDTLSDEVEEAI